MEGVVRMPSAFSMTFGVFPSITATQEFVVPRSMPIVLLIQSSSVWRTHLARWHQASPQKSFACDFALYRKGVPLTQPCEAWSPAASRPISGVIRTDDRFRQPPHRHPRLLWRVVPEPARRGLLRGKEPVRRPRLSG